MNRKIGGKFEMTLEYLFIFKKEGQKSYIYN